MTNANNTVLYTGVTNNLERRTFEHKEKKGSTFTSKYKITNWYTMNFLRLQRMQ